MRFLLLAILMTGCASIVKGRTQEISITNSEGVQLVSTPYGDFRGPTATVPRSQNDVPVTVRCVNGESKQSYLFSRFDWGWGIVGNLFSFQIIGWIVDPVSDGAYDFRNIDLSGFCKSN